MAYGLTKNDSAQRESWKRLLLQDRELDTAALAVIRLQLAEPTTGVYNPGVAKAYCEPLSCSWRTELSGVCAYSPGSGERGGRRPACGFPGASCREPIV
jgi:hypothetical protein